MNIIVADAWLNKDAWPEKVTHVLNRKFTSYDAIF